MAIEICLNEIKKNIRMDCDTVLKVGYKNVAIIANRENLIFEKNSDGTYKFDFVSAVDNFHLVRNRLNKPFEGTTTENADGNPYEGKFTKSVKFDIPMRGAEVSKEIVDAIFAGEEFVMILEREADNGLEIFGIETGLKIEAGSRDHNANGYWEITLVENFATTAEIFYFDTDDEQTRFIFNTLTNNGLIWFTIDVATLGDFSMIFEGGRAWLDTTELTANVAVPNVVGKHVVVIEDRIGAIIIADNRLQGVLNTGEYTGSLIFGFGANHMLTQIIAPKARFIDGYRYDNTTPNNTLTSIIAPVAIEVNTPFHEALTELYAPNADRTIMVYACTALEDITCPAVFGRIGGQATAFTAATIAKLLRQSVESGWTEHNVPNNGRLILKLEQEDVTESVTTVGTNAPYSEWSQQAKDDLEILLQRGWIVSYTE